MFNLFKKLTEPETKELATELKQFDITEAAIATMAADYMPLVVNGLEDKEGLAKVHAARMDVRNKRCRVEDRRKELVADALKHQRNVNAVAKHITTQLEQIEGHLQQEEDKIARVKEEARRAQMRIEEERINRERQEAVAKALAEEKAKLQEETRRREAAERQAAELEANRKKAEAERLEWEERIRKEQAEVKAERQRLEEERKRLEAQQAPENFHTGGPDLAEVELEAERKRLASARLLPDSAPRQVWPDQDPKKQRDDQLDRIQDAIEPLEEIDAVEGVAPIIYTMHDGSPAELCWECTGAGACGVTPCKICRGTGLLPEGTFAKLRSESQQDTDATKILHRCDLIVENLSDPEAFQSKDAGVLWEGFASDVRERVALLRKHVAQYLPNSKP